MGALDLQIHGVERLAGGHEQPDTPVPPKATLEQISGKRIWPIFVPSGACNAPVVSVAGPSSASPDVTIRIATNTVVTACLVAQLRVTQHAPVPQGPAVYNIEGRDAAYCPFVTIVGRARVSHIELFIVGGAVAPASSSLIMSIFPVWASMR